MEILMIVGSVLLCLPGYIMAISNAIRADPPFTIVEKKEDTKTTNKH